jgi:hypothetical protein
MKRVADTYWTHGLIGVRFQVDALLAAEGPELLNQHNFLYFISILIIPYIIFYSYDYTDGAEFEYPNILTQAYFCQRINLQWSPYFLAKAGRKKYLDKYWQEQTIDGGSITNERRLLHKEM